jgi:molybdenum cofactor cytidylyltransferase
MSEAGLGGVLLAAGTSSRMGQNKLLLQIGGTTLLVRAVRTAAAAGLDPILVVLGHEADRAARELHGLPCVPVLNSEYRQGQASSLRAGFAALPDQVAGAVVMLADMPFVTADMIRALFVPEAPLVISTYDGVVAPPTLYRRELFPELRALSGEGCGKQVIRSHRDQAVELQWPAAALRDVDVAADIDRARAELGAC